MQEEWEWPISLWKYDLWHRPKRGLLWTEELLNAGIGKHSVSNSKKWEVLSSVRISFTVLTFYTFCVLTPWRYYRGSPPEIQLISLNSSSSLYGQIDPDFSGNGNARDGNYGENISAIIGRGGRRLFHFIWGVQFFPKSKMCRKRPYVLSFKNWILIIKAYIIAIKVY